jgi:hypothetical protein
MRLRTLSQKFRRTTLRVGLLTLPLHGFMAAPASATSVVALDLPSLARTAELIVAGRVEAVVPYREGGRIYTRVTLRVAETLKPEAAGDARPEVSFSVHGGELDGLGQFVAGQARFEVGEQVVVFLTDLGRRPTLLGMAQGKWAYDPARRGAELTPDVSGLAGLERLGADGRPVAPSPTTPVGLDAVRAALRGGASR